ncbi:DUF2938 domain-containing protein [Pontibacter sp. G13]|uniref:DUF2938 domain-containing protein n=1 Tax=Pontibacter sp. G13 TaxID=3074898 RepID=UPI00288A87CD|nr:DUF2938 domain-containing protein [Pontibacter sp. G13]WNJ18272.1 DUF2938 domain-containing protein [Pontibacter sp. G13]
MNTMLQITVIGFGATVIMDVYAWVLRLFGIKGLDYRFLGRWIGYLAQGKFFHHTILETPAIRYEKSIGQIAHYAIGIAFAYLLVLLFGVSWLDDPTPFPAWTVGVLTMLAPFLIMQPAFGFGIAGARLPNPQRARWMSLLIHGVYGSGLYLSAWFILQIRV